MRKFFLCEGVSKSMLRKQWDLSGFRGGWLEILAWLTNKFYGALNKINCTWKNIEMISHAKKLWDDLNAAEVREQ